MNYRKGQTPHPHSLPISLQLKFNYVCFVPASLSRWGSVNENFFTFCTKKVFPQTTMISKYHRNIATTASTVMVPALRSKKEHVFDYVHFPKNHGKKGVNKKIIAYSMPYYQMTAYRNASQINATAAVLGTGHKHLLTNQMHFKDKHHEHHNTNVITKLGTPLAW